MEHETDIISTITVDTEEETPSFVKAEPTNSTIKKETQRFTDYSFAPSKKDYEEFEIIQSYRPKKVKKEKKNTEFDELVNSQTSYKEDNETFIYEKAKPQTKSKKTSKIFITICCAIAVMLGSLSIVNAFRINQISYDNLSTTQKIANVGKEIVRIEQVIEGMTSEEQIKQEVDAEMEDVSETTKITLKQKQQVEQYQRKTNFFDKICNFFSSLFGG